MIMTDKIYIERKQITFNVHPNLHKEIKKRAVEDGDSMNKWISEAIYEKLKKEKKQNA